MAIIAAGVITVARPFWPKPSVEATARKAMACWVADDAGCLASLAEPSELKALNMNKASVQRLLAEYVLPPFRGASFASEAELSASELDQKVFLTRSFLLKSGRIVPVTFIATASKEGPKIAGLASLSFLISVEARRPKEDTSKVGRFEAFMRAGEKDGPMLAAMGFKGIWRERTGVLTWPKFVEDQRTRIAKMKRSLAASASGKAP